MSGQDYIFWMQNESVQQGETLRLNGRNCTSDEVSEVFNFLTSNWNYDDNPRSNAWNVFKGWFRFKKHFQKQFPEKSSRISPNLILFHRGDNKNRQILIQALVNETDVCGRKMPYIFCAPRDVFKSRLSSEIKQVGKSINQEDVSFINEFLKDYLRKKKLLELSLVGIVIAIIVMIVLII